MEGAKKPQKTASRRSTRRLALRGGIDLGGTKIEAIVVDAVNTVLGSVPAPDALYRWTHGGGRRDDHRR